MLHLLMSPRTARTMRGLIGAIADVAADTIRAAINPATPVGQPDATTAVTTVDAADPADVYSEAEMPELADIERAALSLDLAADNARRADRAKRAARKVLDRLPAGTYGNWIVERVTSNRQTADLDKIRAIFKANGLGPVPMRTNAPSLKVRRAELGVPADTDASTPALAAA